MGSFQVSSANNNEHIVYFQESGVGERKKRRSTMCCASPKTTFQLCVVITLTWTSTGVVFLGKLTGLHDMDMRSAISILVGALNLLTAFLFLIDKACARCHPGGGSDRYDFQRYEDEDGDSSCRVSEVVLYYMTFFGSPIGALFGFACGHKTAKTRFKAIIVFFLFFNLAWVFVYCVISDMKFKRIYH